MVRVRGFMDNRYGKGKSESIDGSKMGFFEHGARVRIS